LKIHPVASVKRIAFCLVPVLIMISGCVAVNQTQLPAQENNHSVKYRSELVDPDAKAFFFFSKFRVLGAENRWDEAITALEQAISFDPQSEYLQLILSRAFLHRQQPEQAVAVLEKLLAEDPENVAGHELLGDVFSFQQKYTLAIDHFRRASQLKPESAVLSLRVAMALARLERNGEAITVLEALLQDHPDADLASLTLARLYLLEEQSEKAFTIYRQLLERQPDQSQVVLEFGKLLAKEDPAAALKLYQSFIIRNPRGAAVRQRLAQYFLEHNQLDAALAQLETVQQQFPGNVKTLHQIGLIQLEREQWDDAESTFRLLLESGDAEGNSRYYLALALSEQEQLAEAIAVLEPLSGDSPIYTEASLQLAYLYKQTQQNERAISLLQQLLEQDIERPDLYYYLVVFLDDSGDYKQAIDIALVGVEKYPESVQLLYQLGVLYEKSADRRAATAVMEKILLIDDAYPDALNFLAYGQAESGLDLELALSRAEKALAIKPSGYIVDTLGWILFKMGRYSESREQLEKAIELHPDDAVIQEHLGDLYRAMKLWDEAEAAYRAALKKDPHSVSVEEKLRRLPLERQ